MATKKKKTDRVAELEAQVARQDEALDQARKGLFRIINTRSDKFVSGLGKEPAIVKAFGYVKGIAERTVLNISDAVAEPETDG